MLTFRKSVLLIKLIPESIVSIVVLKQYETLKCILYSRGVCHCAGKMCFIIQTRLTLLLSQTCVIGDQKNKCNLAVYAKTNCKIKV